MSVKRYAPETSMVDDQHFGEWVRYEDYVALNEEWKAATRHLRGVVDRLRASVTPAPGDPEGSPHTKVIG